VRHKVDEREIWNMNEINDGIDIPTVSLVEERLLACPEAMAVSSTSRTITSTELAGASTNFAIQLQTMGHCRGDPVAVALGRSVELMIALLGIMKAGGIYVPMDLGYPADRINYMIADCGAKILVGEQSFFSSFSLPDSIQPLEISEQVFFPDLGT
jgi:non-ribosomal peptide synthetase component F